MAPEPNPSKDTHTALRCSLLDSHERPEKGSKVQCEPRDVSFSDFPLICCLLTYLSGIFKGSENYYRQSRSLMLCEAPNSLFKGFCDTSVAPRFQTGSLSKDISEISSEKLLYWISFTVKRRPLHSKCSRKCTHFVCDKVICSMHHLFLISVHYLNLFYWKIIFFDLARPRSSVPDLGSGAFEAAYVAISQIVFGTCFSTLSSTTSTDRSQPLCRTTLRRFVIAQS